MSQFSFQPDPLQETVPVVSVAAPETGHEYILSALSFWVVNHPAPDQPVLSFANLGACSPRQLYAEVEKQTEIGRTVEKLIVFGAGRVDGSLADVLRSFYREGAGESGA